MSEDRPTIHVGQTVTWFARTSGRSLGQVREINGSEVTVSHGGPNPIGRVYRAADLRPTRKGDRW